ncbi:hypothetical protein [Spirosoma fluminis]
MFRSTYWICLALLGLFVFKILRFQTLSYTFNDMYAFIQMSHSWMDGRPFMYENIWGYHHNIHNYYTVLLWGPLCHFFGAYGLFAAQTGLLLISYAWVNQRLNQREAPNWTRGAVLLVILLGPITFWLNDHPNIGWHTELTYLPFALLFALTLSGKKPWAAVVAGVAIALVKEDGAVVGALIHLTFDRLRYVRQRADWSLGGWLGRRQIWFIAIGWTLVFVAGMVWLGYKNDFAEPRLQVALKLIHDNVYSKAFWDQTLRLIGKSLLLLLPVILVLTGLVRQLPGRPQVQLLLMWGIGIGVLTILNFVQSSHYYDQPLFYLVSLTWPPRFVLVWAFSGAFLVLLLDEFADRFRPMPLARAWVLGGLLFLIQLPVLDLVRPDFIAARDWIATMLGQYSPYKNRVYLQPEDIASVKCLADKLPNQANVFAFDYVVPYFHRQYEIWPTGKQYRPADVAVLPIDDPQQLRSRLPMRRPYQIIRLKAYNIYAAAGYEQLARQCIPAGKPND